MAHRGSNKRSSRLGGRLRLGIGRECRLIRPQTDIALIGNRSLFLRFGMDSREDCLRQAEECDRLAAEAQMQSNRSILLSAASMWRKLAAGFEPFQGDCD
jgi:hypothetical protein